MNWDDHEGPLHYFGSVPIDTASPPRVGEEADLTMDGFEFEVRIIAIDRDQLTGEVVAIGPSPALEACGIERGDEVSFFGRNILTLKRNN